MRRYRILRWLLGLLPYWVREDLYVYGGHCAALDLHRCPSGGVCEDCGLSDLEIYRDDRRRGLR